MNTAYDIIIIGTGAGGSTIAHSLAPSGKQILILERGDFLVRSPSNWDPEKVFKDEIYHTSERWIAADGHDFRPGQAYLVGGQTKVFGAALLRLRKKDFEPISYEDGLSPAWPIRYDDLEPYYGEAERLYFVHGERGEDSTEPYSSTPYPYPALSHEPRISELFRGLQKLGKRPFHLPIGVQRFEDDLPGSACIRCSTCDGFPCLVNAKGDAEMACLRHAISHKNVTLLTRARVEKIETDGTGRQAKRVIAARDGQSVMFSAETIIVACGAINSALLLLRSRNSKHPNGLANSSGLVGLNYMCHMNSAMLAISPSVKNPTLFQKTIGLNDWYFANKTGAVGHVQLLGKSSEGILRADQPRVPRVILRWMAEHSVDWWFTTEDLPKKENRVFLRDGKVHLHRKPTNTKPHALLIREFKRVLGKLGFKIMIAKPMEIQAVAHQVGTTVFGTDPAHSVLDPWCRAHDLDNLYVVDGGFFPSSSACNPALTIAAQALRVGEHLKKTLGISKPSVNAPIP